MPDPPVITGTASGIIIDTAGHIDTNGHVVGDSSRVKATSSDGYELDDQSVAISNELVDYLSSRAVGARLHTTVYRDGVLRQVTAKLTKATDGDKDRS